MKIQILKLILSVILFIVLTTLIVDIYTEKYWHIPFMILALYLGTSNLWYTHYNQGLIKFGCTRVVYLIGPYAFKFPIMDKWEHFLQGLLGNIQERFFARKCNLQGKLCPVYFSMWGGLVNVMPRCTAVEEKDFPHHWNFEEWTDSEILENGKYFVTVGGLPVENKLSSFGKLPNGNLVAVDFGTWDRVTYKEIVNE